VEALRHKVELLQLNLDVLLEKVHAQEAELRTLRERAQLKASGREYTIREHVPVMVGNAKEGEVTIIEGQAVLNLAEKVAAVADPVQQVQDAVKAYRGAREPEARRRALAALEKALEKLKEQPK
jgi:hypothetical protein